MKKTRGQKSRATVPLGKQFRSEAEFTNILRSCVYLGYLKSWPESRFQEVVIHQFRAKNATWVAFLPWVVIFNKTDQSQDLDGVFTFDKLSFLVSYAAKKRKLPFSEYMHIYTGMY